MLSEEKMSQILQILEGTSRDTLYRWRGRKALAKKISNSIGMFECRVQDFLYELDGLDWHKDEDYNFFLEYIRNGL